MAIMKWILYFSLLYGIIDCQSSSKRFLDGNVKKPENRRQDEILLIESNSADDSFQSSQVYFLPAQDLPSTNSPFESGAQRIEAETESTASLFDDNDFNHLKQSISIAQKPIISTGYATTHSNEKNSYRKSSQETSVTSSSFASSPFHVQIPGQSDSLVNPPIQSSSSLFDTEPSFINDPPLNTQSNPPSYISSSESRPRPPPSSPSLFESVDIGPRPPAPPPDFTEETPSPAPYQPNPPSAQPVAFVQSNGQVNQVSLTWAQLQAMLNPSTDIGNIITAITNGGQGKNPLPAPPAPPGPPGPPGPPAPPPNPPGPAPPAPPFSPSSIPGSSFNGYDHSPRDPPSTYQVQGQQNPIIVPTAPQSNGQPGPTIIIVTGQQNDPVSFNPSNPVANPSYGSNPPANPVSSYGSPALQPIFTGLSSAPQGPPVQNPVSGQNTYNYYFVNKDSVPNFSLSDAPQPPAPPPDVIIGPPAPAPPPTIVNPTYGNSYGRIPSSPTIITSQQNPSGYGGSLSNPPIVSNTPSLRDPTIIYGSPSPNSAPQNPLSNYGSSGQFNPPVLNPPATPIRQPVFDPTPTYGSVGQLNPTSGYGSTGQFSPPALNPPVFNPPSGYGSTGQFNPPVSNPPVLNPPSGYGTTGQFNPPVSNPPVLNPPSGYGSTGQFNPPVSNPPVLNPPSGYGSTGQFNPPVSNPPVLNPPSGYGSTGQFNPPVSNPTSGYGTIGQLSPPVQSNPLSVFNPTNGYGQLSPPLLNPTNGYGQLNPPSLNPSSGYGQLASPIFNPTTSYGNVAQNPIQAPSYTPSLPPLSAPSYAISQSDPSISYGSAQQDTFQPSFLSFSSPSTSQKQKSGLFNKGSLFNKGGLFNKGRNNANPSSYPLRSPPSTYGAPPATYGAPPQDPTPPPREPLPPSDPLLSINYEYRYQGPPVVVKGKKKKDSKDMFYKGAILLGAMAALPIVPTVIFAGRRRRELLDDIRQEEFHLPLIHLSQYPGKEVEKRSVNETIQTWKNETSLFDTLPFHGAPIPKELRQELAKFLPSKDILNDAECLQKSFCENLIELDDSPHKTSFLFFYSALSPEADVNPWLQQSLTAAKKKKCQDFYCVKPTKEDEIKANED